jgi:hypothetical protein
VLKSGQTALRKAWRPADIEVGRVAGRVLALVHGLVVGLLVGLADRDVADLLEAEIDRVGLPHVDRVLEDVCSGLVM